MKTAKLSLAAPLLTLGLLAILVVESVLRTSPASAEPYHQHIAAVATTLPYQAGNWVGEDIPVPSAATELLHPNVIISRRYQNIRTGHSASFLLVQCRDTRDMVGHYPPICYPANGWTQVSDSQREALASDATYPAMEYDFTRTTGGQLSRVTVIDFMVLPDGRVFRTMEELRTSARKREARFYGAAQIQLVFDPGVPDLERDQAVKTILDAAEPILMGIKSGERQ